MPKKRSTKSRRNERMTSLVSVGEVKRIKSFARFQKMGVSELLRHCVLSQVEVWEKQE